LRAEIAVNDAERVSVGYHDTRLHHEIDSLRDRLLHQNNNDTLSATMVTTP
jgi:hypothetical protein